MSLRINNNIQAINGLRQVSENDANMGRSLEKLSSGMKINRAADGPASLIISQQMRAQIAGLNQALDNSEIARSMVQTSEAALTEVSNALVQIRQLSIHAANSGANDENMLAADQLEISNTIKTIDRISRNASFGTKHLLDGSTGANGVGIGEGLEFVTASPVTRTSPVEGYVVKVTQQGTQSTLQGNAALSQEIIDSGEQIVISEGGKTVFFEANAGDSLPETIGKLRDEITVAGLNVKLDVDENNMLKLTHNDFGSDSSFTASSSTAGLLSQAPKELQDAVFGKDIQGSIGGEFSTGSGLLLTGGKGTRVEGLQVRYNGNVTTPPESGEDAPVAGRVGLYQNSLVFQVGPNPGQTSAISLINTNSRQLGKGIPTESGYKNLKDVDVTTQQGAQDALRLVDQAINDVSLSRAKMGAFQKNTVETNMRQLSINMQELVAAESVIRDADMAKEISEFTKNSIMMQSSTAMLAQANQAPQAVLSLLNSQ